MVLVPDSSDGGCDSCGGDLRMYSGSWRSLSMSSKS